MTSYTFGTRYYKLSVFGRSVFTENSLNSHGLKLVVVISRSSMRINIADISFLYTSHLNSHFHSSSKASTFWGRSSNVVCIACRSVSNQFTIYFSTSFLSRFQRLDQDNPSSFSHNKPPTIGIKWPRSFRRIIIVISLHSLHGTKSGKTKRRNCRFCTSSNHHIRVTVLNHSKSFSNGMTTTRTGRSYTIVRSLCTSLNTNNTRGSITQQGRNSERRNLRTFGFLMKL
mmetsp:Transcript_2185/g.2977  ORF Transcript_2185/g.2977 Transcript_2185/m.2977 type:complete len:228 (+) Transcript_2185:266-949(+)